MENRIIFRHADQPKTKLVQYKACGLDNVYLINGYRIKQYDGETYMSVKDVEGLHFTIALCLATRLSPLDADEFRFLRSALKQTQVELAQKFEVSRATINRYENGENIPKATRLMLQLNALVQILSSADGMENDRPELVDLVVSKATSYLLGLSSDHRLLNTDCISRHGSQNNNSCLSEFIESPPPFVINAMRNWNGNYILD